MRKSLPWLSRLLLPLVLASSTAHAAFPLGPGTQMPGVHPTVWTNICTRSDNITNILAKLSPNASESKQLCTNLTIKLYLVRLAGLMDSAGRGGSYFVRAIERNADGNPAGFSGYVEHGTERVEAPRWFDSERANEKAGPTNSLDGAATKIVKELNEKCQSEFNDDDTGPGGGMGIRGFEKWKSGKDFATNPEFGPPVIPRPVPVEQLRASLTSSEVRAAAAKAYPSVGFDELVGRLLSGHASMADVERLHFVFGTTAYLVTYSAREGLMMMGRAAAARVLPVWVMPPGQGKVPGKDGDPRKGL